MATQGNDSTKVSNSISTKASSDIKVEASERGHLALTGLDPYGNPLVPPLTSDPQDPMNWPLWRKYVCILIVCISYFMFTYFTTTTIPSFALLQEQFNATYTEVNWTFAISNLGLAIGPLLTGSLADTYGRRPVMICGCIIALVASGCTSIKTISLNGYMTARFFQGLGSAPASNVGLSIINDLSWEHERGQRIGLWTMSVGAGGFVGAVVGAFLATIDQFWAGYHVAIMFALLLVLECCFLPETLYPRELVVQAEMNQIQLDDTGLKRTTQLGYFSLNKVPGVPHPKPWHGITQFCKLWTYPTIVISLGAYLFGQYWWICSLLTMEPAAYENYPLQIQGLLFIGLLVGVVSAEALCSGRLSDRIMAILTKRNDNQRVPEMRLWLGYPAAVISAIGVLLWGLSVDNHWHWMVGQVAFFLYAFGQQTGNTVVSSYLVDNYPEHANEVITFYAVILNLSAFADPWFINIWVDASGYTWSFAAQAIICVGLVIPAYAVLQNFGPRLRKPMRLEHTALESVIP
ncbi:hypothetical protein VE03_09066 [Pseudogymnoascus sp. 23342-1-I1]|nr:hypothetical protein VE03_09066 [Pseudogymnoascus sp. 23342-1-I1]